MITRLLRAADADPRRLVPVKTAVERTVSEAESCCARRSTLRDTASGGRVLWQHRVVNVGAAATRAARHDLFVGGEGSCSPS